MSVGVRAITFNGKNTAEKALHLLEDNAPVYRWVDDIAVVSRGKFGGLHVHSTWAQDDDITAAGVGWGAITGGLVGALAGPGGALAGAAAGSGIAGSVGLAMNMDMDDPRLDQFAESLDKNSSALILVADDPTLDEFMNAVQVTDDVAVFETDLDEKDIKKLKKALKH